MEKFKTSSHTIYLKLYPSIHPLSMEQQKFFLKITNGIFGYSEKERKHSLLVLQNDPNIAFLMPYLSTFIKETIHLNIVRADAPCLLFYAMLMVKYLSDNCNLKILKYLHEIIPAVISCGVTKQISARIDDEWGVRDYAAYLIALISQKYNSPINEITKRVTEIYKKPFVDEMPFTTVYGAVKGISCLGESVVVSELLPNLKKISQKFELMNERARRFYTRERAFRIFKEADKVREAITKAVAPVLGKMETTVNDGGLSYVQQFGCLGKNIYDAVKVWEKVKKEDGVENVSGLMPMANFQPRFYSNVAVFVKQEH